MEKCLKLNFLEEENRIEGETSSFVSVDLNIANWPHGSPDLNPFDFFFWTETKWSETAVFQAIRSVWIVSLSGRQNQYCLDWLLFIKGRSDWDG